MAKKKPAKKAKSKNGKPKKAPGGSAGKTVPKKRGIVPKPLCGDVPVRDLDMFRRSMAGEFQADIAKSYNISQQRISQICERTATALARQQVERIDELRAEHTERLMHKYREAMKGWERSCEDAQTVSVKESTDENGDPIREVTTTLRGQSGDSSKLNQAITALEHIRKIWGVDKIVTDKGDRAPNVIEIVVQNREQARQVMLEDIVEGKMILSEAKKDGKSR